jgi:N-acetylmuramic acid 6-phosphate etherase
MKAGTAQKLVLNAFSTAVMIRLGRTYSNLMVDLVASNAKLRGRMLDILGEATGLDEATCAQALTNAGGELKTALVAVLGGVDPARARAALDHAGGHVHAALAKLTGP